MYENTIKMLLLVILIFNLKLYAEIDMQKGVYDAAEEMIRFDEKMNKAIAEHNQINAEDDAEMRLQAMMVNDFAETKEGYVLIQKIEDPEHTKVKVKLDDGLLVITTTTEEKEFFAEELNISEIETMSSFNVSLFIPPNADETKMKKSYENGILKISFPKQ